MANVQFTVGAAAAGKRHLSLRPYTKIFFVWSTKERVSWVSQLADEAESRTWHRLEDTRDYKSSAKAENQGQPPWSPQKFWKGCWASLQVCNGESSQFSDKYLQTEWPQLKSALCEENTYTNICKSSIQISIIKKKKF